MNRVYLAHITINPSQDRNEVIAALRELESLTQQESGCELFRVFETPDKSELVIWEVFESDEALQSHYQSPHTTHYFNKGYTSIKSFYAIEPLQSLDEHFQQHFLQPK